MKQNWEVGGEYASRRMTITVGPPEGKDEPDIRFWHEKDLNSLATHFKELVWLWELEEAHERLA